MQMQQLVSGQLKYLILIFFLSFSSEDGASGSSFSDCIEFSQESYSQQFNFDIGDGLLQKVPKDAVISKITVHIYNVFDVTIPEEDTWYGRLANKLHILTHKNIILRQLLFRVGDKWSALDAVESERLLRSNSYLYDAKVRPVRICGDQVEVQVIVRDVWTLTGGFGLSRSGGENKTSTSITDKNFLGTGTFLSIGSSNDTDRDSHFISFAEPNLLGSRWQLKTSYKDNDDGDGHLFSVNKPFYSLDTRHGYHLSILKNESVDKLYYRDRIIEQFSHHTKSADISVGFSKGLVDKKAYRWTIGAHMEEHGFEATLLTQDINAVPLSRERHYLWLGLDRIEDNFMESQHFEQIVTTEDIFLGQRLNLQLGYGNSSGDMHNNFWYLSTSIEDSFRVMESSLLFTSLVASGYWDNSQNDWENLILKADSRWLINPFADNQWLLSGKFTYSRNLTSDRQLLLGGDNGLRGYPARYQLGDRSFLISLERRHFLDWNLWGIFNFGATSFIDVGRAWFPEGSHGINGGNLMDIGFGLRISSSRFHIDRVLHIDLAFPLIKGDPTIDDVQLVITGQARF